MPQHLHQYLSLHHTDRVKVGLKGKAQVMLMDDANYTSYQNGQEYEYFGGLAARTPCVLAVPATGNWHLVIQQADPRKDVMAHVQIIRENL